VGALNGVQSSVEALRMTLENNRNVMLERLEAIPGVKVAKPDGTFTASPIQRLHEGFAEAGHFLLQKVRVVSVPGKEFGFEGTCA